MNNNQSSSKSNARLIAEKHYLSHFNELPPEGMSVIDIADTIGKKPRTNFVPDLKNTEDQMTDIDWTLQELDKLPFALRMPPQFLTEESLKAYIDMNVELKQFSEKYAEIFKGLKGEVIN